MAYILLAAAALLAVWFAWTFNRLVSLRNRMRAAWASVDTLLKRRADLVPNLVQAVKGAMSFEQRTFTEVATARNEALAAGGAPHDTAARAQAENALTGQLHQLLALAEAYPDLKSSENVLALQKQLVETENDIAGARRYYNAVVRDYNTLRETFPTLLVAGPLGFGEGQYFELSDITERDAPVTNLGASE